MTGFGAICAGAVFFTGGLAAGFDAAGLFAGCETCALADAASISDASRQDAIPGRGKEASMAVIVTTAASPPNFCLYPRGQAACA